MQNVSRVSALYCRLTMCVVPVSETVCRSNFEQERMVISRRLEVLLPPFFNPVVLVVCGVSALPHRMIIVLLDALLYLEEREVFSSELTYTTLEYPVVSSQSSHVSSVHSSWMKRTRYLDSSPFTLPYARCLSGQRRNGVNVPDLI